MQALPHAPHSQMAQLHVAQLQEVPHEQAGVHEQPALRVTSASGSVICVYIEHLVFGLTRYYGRASELS